MPDPSFTDDSSIRDDAELWRRVPHWQYEEEEDGSITLSSAVFSPRRLSVTIAEDVLTSGRTPENIVEEFPNFGLLGITAGNARACAQIIYRLPENDEPAHAEVYGNKTKSVKRKLKEEALGRGWVVFPSPPDSK